MNPVDLSLASDLREPALPEHIERAGVPLYGKRQAERAAVRRLRRKSG